jgi:hypothetical protein
LHLLSPQRKFVFPLCIIYWRHSLVCTVAKRGQKCFCLVLLDSA